jgi:hypothetical protein
MINIYFEKSQTFTLIYKIYTSYKYKIYVIFKEIAFKILIIEYK